MWLSVFSTTMVGPKYYEQGGDIISKLMEFRPLILKISTACGP